MKFTMRISDRKMTTIQVKFHIGLEEIVAALIVNATEYGLSKRPATRAATMKIVRDVYEHHGHQVHDVVEMVQADQEDDEDHSPKITALVKRLFPELDTTHTEG